MRKTGIRRLREMLGSTMAFVAVTGILVVMIAFCVTGTVISQSDMGMQEVENYYREQERVLLQNTREQLREMGYTNCGVTLTRVVDAEGNREYTFTIHHGKIDKMSDTERDELAKLLACGEGIDENCTFYHEFLLYD
ncbi:MAG: hypothetical protein E7291_04575 [Lachnospiraceae bacterium]|nr:hypothetical protein [Lachnospiraceae bacterium]